MRTIACAPRSACLALPRPIPPPPPPPAQHIWNPPTDAVPLKTMPLRTPPSAVGARPTRSGPSVSESVHHASPTDTATAPAGPAVSARGCIGPLRVLSTSGLAGLRRLLARWLRRSSAWRGTANYLAARPTMPGTAVHSVHSVWYNTASAARSRHEQPWPTGDCRHTVQPCTTDGTDESGPACPLLCRFTYQRCTRGTPIH
jgi:hypothetical protein